MSLRPHQARMEQVERDQSGLVEVGWAWYEKVRGIVAWGFRNLDSSQHNVILLRNSYYFGDAYWPVYAANKAFRTSFLYGGVSPSPLYERTVPQNSPPLALVQFADSSRTLVCFVFTLSPGQAWAMLEGGFGALSPPSGLAVYSVTPVSGGDFCLGYDQRSVSDWYSQTRTRLDGYAPNPSTFNTWLFQAESIAIFQKLFQGDHVAAGRCGQEAQMQTPAEQRRPAGETSGLFPAVFPDVISPPVNP